MTLVALAVPFMGGTASAAATEPWTVSLSPASDSATVGTCDARTVTVIDKNGNAVVGQTVNVTLTQTSVAGANLIIGFCNPGNATNPNRTGTVPTATGGGVSAGNGSTAAGSFGTQAQGPPTAGQSASGVANHCSGTNTNVSQTVSCVGTFNEVTDANGILYFGADSNQVGQMGVIATATAPGTPGNTYQSPSSQINWISGNLQATAIDCSWDANGQGAGGAQLSGQGTNDATAADTSHQETFTCKVTGSGGQPVNGANVFWQYNSGPDTPTTATVQNTCANPTSPTGTVTCTQTHTGSGATTNKTGTDNFTVWAEQGCPPPSGQSVCSPAGSPSFQSYEPNEVLTKTFVSAPRNITCNPGAGTTTQKPSGQTQNIICTATDVNGKAVPGALIFAQINGPGHFTNQSAAACGATSGQSCLFTDGNGQASFQVQTNPGEVGLTTINFQLNVNFPQQNPSTAECNKAAGNPGGSTAGNCTTSTQINWTEASPSNVTHTRSITANASKRGRCPNRRHPRRGPCSAVVTGVVTDTSTSPSTSCTSGVQVLVIQERTGKSHTVITDATGAYTTSFRGKPRRGNYTATAPQFTTGNITCGGATATDSI